MNSAEKEYKNRHKIILNHNPSTKNNILFCEKIFNDFHWQTKANKLKKEAIIIQFLTLSILEIISPSKS